MCTVTKVQYHSVFVNLDEFERRQGLIHISEVSPGRIRNINDYVQEGKKVVCKVLRISMDRGHIDLSLRRVSNIQKRNKVEEIKQEQKAEKILEFVGKDFDLKMRDLNKIVAPKLLKDYDSLHAAFEEVSFDEVKLEDLGIEEKYAKPLTEIIKQRIKPPVVQITGELTLSTYDANGVDVVKSILIKSLVGIEDTKIVYVGGGKYSIAVTKNDYKEAEEELKKVTDILEEDAKEQKCDFEFKRLESRKIKD